MRTAPVLVATALLLVVALLLAVLAGMLAPTVVVIVAVGVCALMMVIGHGHEGAR